jgi:hypothetical protein
LKLFAGLLCKRRVTTRTYSRPAELNQAFKEAQSLPFLPASPMASVRELEGPVSETRSRMAVAGVPREQADARGFSPNGGGERFT